MIAVKNFGGRLGNWMFQYASLIGIKYKTNFQCVLTKDQVANSVLKKTFCLQEAKEVPYMPLCKNIYKESSFKYEPNFFTIKDDTFIEGYF